MKLAICVNFHAPLIGGCEYVTLKIANHFTNIGHDVTVITRKYKKRNHKIYPYKISEYFPGDLIGFQKKIRELNPDVLFIYSDVFDFFHHVLGSFNGKIIVALCGANWIYKNRSFGNMFYGLSKKIHTIICHSNIDRDYKICDNNKLLHKTKIIPNGIDIKEFDQNIIGRDLLSPNIKHKRWILNIANFFPGKGQNFVFDVLNNIPNNNEYVYIQIASDIDFNIGLQLEHKWKILASKNKHINSILVKNPNRESVVAYLKQSNVFLFPSEKEVAPIVLLESMAAKTPWVAMDIGNAKELKGGKCIAAVKDSKYYSLCDSRVINLMAKAVTECVNNPTIANDGRVQIEQQMNWDIILPQYEKVFL